MHENKDSIYLLKTNEADEMIGQPPNWLIRWGVIVFLTILLFIGSMIYWIRYPEYLNVPFKTKSKSDSIYIMLEVPVLYISHLKTGLSFKLKFDVDRIPLFEPTIFKLQQISGEEIDSVVNIVIFITRKQAIELNSKRNISVGTTGTAEILVDNPRLSEKIFRTSFIK